MSSAQSNPLNMNDKTTPTPLVSKLDIESAVLSPALMAMATNEYYEKKNKAKLMLYELNVMIHDLVRLLKTENIKSIQNKKVEECKEITKLLVEISPLRDVQNPDLEKLKLIATNACKIVEDSGFDIDDPVSIEQHIQNLTVCKKVIFAVDSYSNDDIWLNRNKENSEFDHVVGTITKALKEIK